MNIQKSIENTKSIDISYDSLSTEENFDLDIAILRGAEDEFWYNKFIEIHKFMNHTMVYKMPLYKNKNIYQGFRNYMGDYNTITCFKNASTEEFIQRKYIERYGITGLHTPETDYMLYYNLVLSCYFQYIECNGSILIKKCQHKRS